MKSEKTPPVGPPSEAITLEKFFQFYATEEDRVESFRKAIKSVVDELEMVRKKLKPVLRYVEEMEQGAGDRVLSLEAREARTAVRLCRHYLREKANVILHRFEPLLATKTGE